MKVNIVCVGKIKENYFTAAIEEYKKRLSKFCEIKIIDVDEMTSVSSVTKKSQIEGQRLLSKCQGMIVALDGNGKAVSSEEFADFFNQKMVSGISEVSLVIGGSNGLSDEVKSAAKFIFSFGKITLPHQLFRVVLIEQVYRAFSILNHLPYHK